MTRDEMLTEVIRKWGFEHKYTIRFAKACEEFKSDKNVRVLFNWEMAKKIEVWDE